jgi:GDPmannose 4,6-dehydratase
MHALDPPEATEAPMRASGRTALVTGAAGQDGILLAELLVAQGYTVCGLVRGRSERTALLEQRVPSVHLEYGDLRERDLVERLLTEAVPDEVYNLAAFSSVGRSWARAHEVMDINALAVVSLLDQLRTLQERTGRDVRFYQASSSEMFGSPAVTPQTEETTFHPRSPYGVAKSAAHFLTMNYRESYGLFACSGILYNHESPLREPHFVTRKITAGVAAIAQGRADRLELGTLDVSRDWGWAPDYVRAMWLMLQHDVPDDYIVASGRSRTLRDFLSAAFACVGIDDWSGYVVSDHSLLRPAEVLGLVGNATKARDVLGWQPTVPFEEIVARMVRHDLETASDISSWPSRP